MSKFLQGFGFIIFLVWLTCFYGPTHPRGASFIAAGVLSVILWLGYATRDKK